MNIPGFFKRKKTQPVNIERIQYIGPGIQAPTLNECRSAKFATHKENLDKMKKEIFDKIRSDSKSGYSASSYFTGTGELFTAGFTGESTAEIIKDFEKWLQHILPEYKIKVKDNGREFSLKNLYVQISGW